MTAGGETPIDGALIAGRYRLDTLLGTGGMSEVRRARDQRIGRWVAVKLLRSELVQDPAFEGRFMREAQSAASLHSRGIVAVYDTGEAEIGGQLRPFIVMELVEGRTLRDALAVDGRMPPMQAARITSAVCEALDEAHRAGIVHRDVKPGNVMLTPAGEVKVMDFGIARATASSITMTQTAAVVGTAHYLSPEQAKGEHVDARSDVYSTGCMLYELLTGAPPFTGETSVAVAYQHVREDPIPPGRLTADIPPALEAVVLKALAKNPANRYQSAGEMRDDLERVLDGQPVTAAPVEAASVAQALPPPPPPTTVLIREPPRRGRRGAAYLLLFIATVAVFVVALLIARSLLRNTNPDLETPDVVGQSQSRAEYLLSQAGLTMDVGDCYKFSATKPYGTVLSQVPVHPILLGRGEAVRVCVSRGVHYVVVPTDVIGEQEDQASVELKQAGFQVAVHTQHNRAAAGQVLSTEPAAGEQAKYGQTINLFVSDAKVAVPGVVGLDGTSGALRLRKADFAVYERDATTYDKSKPIGQIVEQSPDAGAYAATNSTVTIYVNEPPLKPTNSPTTSPPTTSTPPTTDTTSSSPPATDSTTTTPP